jgi:fermentation-respiration switch protein FrsA (DUF1100 family)
VIHGCADEQVPPSEAETVYAAVGSEDKTLRIFRPDEGGTQHCQHDYVTLATSTIFDWFEDRLITP